MTIEEQHVAIAEWLGWEIPSHCITKRRIAGESKRQLRGAPSDFGKNPHSGQWEDIPAFTKDLNAMHKAEIVLQDKCLYWPAYIDELSKLFRCGFPEKDATNWSQMCHATAEQRVEAFLKAVGKWT